MEIRNTHILVRVIHFQSLLSVVYLWLNTVAFIDLESQGITH